MRDSIREALVETKPVSAIPLPAPRVAPQPAAELPYSEFSQKLEDTGWFLRNAPQLPKVGELSELRSGEIELSAERPFPDKIYTQKDNAYILAFKDSQGADMEQFDKEKEQVTKQALAESRQQVLQRFVESLKAKAQIQVHPNALEES